MSNTINSSWSSSPSQSSISPCEVSHIPSNSKGIQKKAPRRQKTSKSFPLFTNHNIHSTSFKVLQSTDNSMMGVFKKTRSMCSLASYETVWNMNHAPTNTIQSSSSLACPIIITTPAEYNNNNTTDNQITIGSTRKKKRVMSSSSLSSMCDSSSSENTIIAPSSSNNPTVNSSSTIPYSNSLSPIRRDSLIVDNGLHTNGQLSNDSLPSPGTVNKKGRSKMPSLRELLN